MKKFLVVLLSVLSTVSIATALTGCSNSGNNENKESEYTVTFNTDGGNEITSQKVKKGEKITKPEDPIKNGYDFAGWYSGEEEWSFIGYVVTDNITLTAKWSLATYSINYVLDGGENNETNPTEYRIDTETITFLKPTKSGYVFDGWYTEDTFVNKVTKLTTGSYGDKILYAKWNKVEYSEGLAYTLLEDDTYAVAGMGTCTDIEIVIPEIYNGKSVTEIAENAFANECKIVEITFPKTIKKIGKDAFSNCDKLIRVNISDITAWLNIDFEGTIGQKITSPGEVYYRAFTLFLDGKQVTSLDAPYGIKTIKQNVFYGCSGLKNVVIPDSVITIENNAFSGCYDLEDVKMGKAIKRIGAYAFEVCAFREIELPDSVTDIGESAFFACLRLTSIIIPDNVTSIGNAAFLVCKELTSVTIGKSVINIGDYAFSECKKLVEVINKSNLAIEKCRDDNGLVGGYALKIKKDGISDVVNKNGYLFYTFGDVNYLLGYVGDDIEITLPDSYNGVTYEIYNYAFENNYWLTTVTISDGASRIGDYAFFLCTGLESVIVKEGVTYIEESSFALCENITSLLLPDSVTCIERFALADCTGLTSITYKGTIAEWNQMKKGDRWNEGVPEDCIIHCTDGDIKISD